MTTLEERKCEECGTPFLPGRKTQRFCSKPCKRRLLHREWVRKNPDRARELDKNRPADQVAKRQQYVREWRVQNRESVRMKDRQRHKDRKEEANAGRLRRYLANHEQNKEAQKVRNYDARVALPWKSLLRSASDRAKAKNLVFELTAEWAKSKWTGKCELSGVPFRIGVKRPTPRLFAPSIDRIVPSEGYTQSNSRFILWAINAMKGEGTDADVLEIAMAICGV